MAIVLRSLSISLAGLLALAAIHKVRVLRAGQAEREPLMRLSRWRRRHANGLLVLAGIVEAAIAVMLLARPLPGFAALAGLTVAYAIDLRGLADDEPCNCFGSALRVTTRRVAIARNVGIAVISVAAAALYATSAVPVAAVSQATIGVALLIAAAATSVDLLRYIPRAPRAEARPESRG